MPNIKILARQHTWQDVNDDVYPYQTAVRGNEQKALHTFRLQHSLKKHKPLRKVLKMLNEETKATLALPHTTQGNQKGPIKTCTICLSVPRTKIRHYTATNRRPPSNEA